MAKSSVSCLFLIVYITILIVENSYADLDVQVITIATEATDGFRRYAKSLKKYNLDLKVFGMGKKWDGGDIAKYAGGGQKVNLLKEGLKEYADRDDLLLMFTDSYDVIFTSGAADIIEKFKKLDARVVFSAEGFCWPDSSLANSYPQVKSFEYRFLNSGGFMGYAKDIYAIVTHKDIGNRDDDQLYYTKIFLDKKLREKWSIKLDTKAEIFQNLNGALGDVSLKSIGSHSYLYNDKTGTTPVVVHGNGPIKIEFNRLANYLADGWTTHSGCISCNENTISLETSTDNSYLLSPLKFDKQVMTSCALKVVDKIPNCQHVYVSDYPTVLMAVFIEQAMPFLPEFFTRLDNLTYPKEKIDLYIHNAVDKYHDEDLKTFLDATKDKYRSVTVIGASDKMTEAAARNWAIDMATMKASQYYFNVDGNTHIREANILQMLIEQNRTVLAPMVKRPYQFWSNFWGAISENGFYARSADYMEIIEDRKKGLWNVPFIASCYLLHGSILPSVKNSYTDKELDPDMTFCQNLREKGIFIYVSNLHFFGHLVNYDNYDTKLTHSDFYQMNDNPWDWEQRYIHENYSQNFDLSKPLLQPCPDVFWFPIVKEIYCDHLVDIMEGFGQWSGGGNKDPRLASGYENVPTIDIHMNQVGLEPQWLEFLKRYVSPLQQRAFEGYFHDPPTALMNFVVRYKPTEQPSLRPHHDSSTFTINLALNRPEIDYQGGGCRFIRYNCSATALRKGWMLMHPGRLTHYHEGLPTTGGTRYIMISFVDP